MIKIKTLTISDTKPWTTQPSNGEYYCELEIEHTTQDDVYKGVVKVKNLDFSEEFLKEITDKFLFEFKGMMNS